MTSRDQLVGDNGQPAYGIFPRGVGDINFMDFDLRNSMDRKIGQSAKRRRFNQFEFTGGLGTNADGAGNDLAWCA